MEIVLDLYKRSYDPRFPVICTDESPKQLIKKTRPPIPAKPGGLLKHDYKYERCGVCNIFLASESLAGERIVKVTEQKTKRDWATFINELADKYPLAEKIILVMDNFKTHCPGAFYEVFQPKKAKRLLNRFQFINTPNLFLTATGRVYVVSASSSSSVQELIWWDYSGNQYPPLTTTITGTNSNDIFIAGYYSSIRHFNGKNWANISPEIERETIWSKITAIEDLVVVIGMNGSYQAAIARGHHQ